MSDQHYLWMILQNLFNNLGQAQGAKLSIQQFDLVPRIEQRTSKREQTQRRQVLAGNATADGRMRRVQKEQLHAHIKTFWQLLCHTKLRL